MLWELFKGCELCRVGTVQPLICAEDGEALALQWQPAIAPASLSSPTFYPYNSRRSPV